MEVDSAAAPAAANSSTGNKRRVQLTTLSTPDDGDLDTSGMDSWHFALGPYVYLFRRLCLDYKIKHTLNHDHVNVYNI